jgi:peroxiredoxin
LLLSLALILPWLFLAVGAWLGFQMLRQNGRILLHLEGLEQRLAQLQTAPIPTPQPVPVPLPSPMPQGLALGGAAPEFELPNLAGGRTALAELRGKRLLLIFFNPRCGFCTRMAPDLARLAVDGANGKPVPLVVTTGEAEENRALFAEHGVHCPVLLQIGMEVASRYQCHGTPMGYLIDEQGKIASAQTVGAQALLALVDAPPVVADSKGNGALGGTRSIADSKLPRNGLAAGAPAPEFTLPRLEGGELSLTEYRGRRVLVVFSDPKCGPCDALAPQLEQAYRHSGDVPIVMISRGDVEANRAKVAEHGLTFPVVLQRQWEISREYAMFATPVAYLVNEDGFIASEVAVGVEPILALLSGAAPPRCRCGQPVAECGSGSSAPAAASGHNG